MVRSQISPSNQGKSLWVGLSHLFLFSLLIVLGMHFLWWLVWFLIDSVDPWYKPMGHDLSYIVPFPIWVILTSLFLATLLFPYSKPQLRASQATLQQDLAVGKKQNHPLLRFIFKTEQVFDVFKVILLAWFVFLLTQPLLWLAFRSYAH